MVRHALAASLMAVGVAQMSAAQAAVRTTPLPAPNAEFAEPLTGPLRVIELRDRRLLVHDGGEKKLATINFADGELVEVAREGNGPTEFRSAIALLRAPNDSIWLYDFLAQRVLVIGPDGKPVRTQLFANSGDPMAMMNRPQVRAHDNAGRAYGEVRGMSFDERRVTFADSVILVRTQGNRVDSIARMPSFVPAPAFNGQKVTIRLPGFVPTDAWGVFPDGRLMIVRGEGYVPELVLPDGTRRTAAAIPFPRIAVTAAEREEMVNDARRRMERSMQTMRGMAGNQPLPEMEVVEPERWQTHKPPLDGTVILVDSRNRAWVPVLKRPGDVGERFDLLDADGRLLQTVTLPRDVTLLAFGNGVAYTTRKDGDDLLWIQRHPLP